MDENQLIELKFQLHEAKKQIAFLVETFAKRDSDQRNEIESLKAQVQQLEALVNIANARLAYYQGVGHGEDKPTIQ